MTETIRVNGRDRPLRLSTLGALLSDVDIPSGGRFFAVALNGAVVPRARWATTSVHHGDEVEIVHPTKGG